MQKLYCKNRQVVFQRIFQNNSLSPELRQEDVFGYWRNLLTHLTLANGSLHDNYPIPPSQRSEKFARLLDFITVEEVMANRLPLKPLLARIMLRYGP